ncbi:THAP domain-containing protein 5-like [Metopolophium dirhodum]|uniref:THAP domain-containing protein 5-like n=1 Tax=Metopolophium dirhodum TaxID=44670 RepID=UPI00298FD110|nr:THAP domain-containing protein 5-like [Metopolophium dirhodum]
MPVSCVAYGCTNRYKSGQNIHFFRFPLNNENVNQKWIIALRRKNFIPSQWSRICSIHFIDNDYEIRPGTTKPCLKIDAVPSNFPSFPSYLQKPAKCPNKYSHSILVNVKNRGGLIKSSINVIKIVRVIENTLIQLTLGLSTLNIPGLKNKETDEKESEIDKPQIVVLEVTTHNKETEEKESEVDEPQYIVENLKTDKNI